MKSIKTKTAWYLICLALMGLNFSCGSSDPFEDYGSDVREATIEEEKPPVPPGINSNSILLVPSKRIFLFEEGVEAAYELNARVFIPDTEFELELINPPPGMTLELKTEFNTDIISTPVGNGTATDTDATTDEEPPAPTMTNQKIYVVKWKPGYDTIPDDSINEIQRHLSVRFKVDDDISTIWEIPYEVIQSERTLKIASASLPDKFLEGEKTSFKVYVEYPNFKGPQYPAMMLYSKQGSNYGGCQNMQNWIRNTGASIVDDQSNPNYGLLEYSFEADFTKLEITENSSTCSVEAFVQDVRSTSAPFELKISVKNVMKNPETTWASGLTLELEQGKQTAFFFQVFGKPGEGNVELDFVSPCKAAFSGNGDCTCAREPGSNNSHIMNCVITADHPVWDSDVTYTLEMKAKIKTYSDESQLVTFTRKVRFYPPSEKKSQSTGALTPEEETKSVPGFTNMGRASDDFHERSAPLKALGAN